MGASPDSATAGRPRIVILENHAAFRQISMRNFVRHTVQAADELGEVRSVHPPRFMARALPQGLTKYAVYFDVYVLAAVRVWLASLRADIVIAADHAYAPALWLVPRRKRTAFVHDLIAVRQARGEIEGAPRVAWSGRLYQRMVLAALLRAQVLGANTEVQAEQLRRLGYRGEVVIVGQALAAERFAKTRPTAARTRPYLLQVTSDSWLKNAPFLLSIYEELCVDLGDRCPDLVVTGAIPPAMLDAAPKAVSTGRLRYVDKPSDPELAKLIRGAAGLIMPSIEEGFGVPPLEALHLGTAIILGDNPVFRHIYAEAADYFDVRDRSKARAQLEVLFTRQGKPKARAAAQVLERYGLSAVFDRTKLWIRAALEAAEG